MKLRYTVDVDVAELYANKQCKHCNGRGIIRYQTGLYATTITKNQPIQEHIRYCVCVRNNSYKYG